MNQHGMPSATMRHPTRDTIRAAIVARLSHARTAAWVLRMDQHLATHCAAKAAQCERQLRALGE